MLKLPRLRRLAKLLLVVSVVLSGLSLGGAIAADPADSLWFIENVGQRDAALSHYLQGASAGIDIETNGTIELSSAGQAVGRLSYDGASNPAIAGAGYLGDAKVHVVGQTGSFVGGVFADVHVVGLYAGIDVTYSGDFTQLQRAISVAPGAAPANVRQRYDAGLTIEVASDGGLNLLDASGALVMREAAPSAYQVGPGGAEPVTAAFLLRPDGAVGIDVGTYDPARVLHIELALLGEGWMDEAIESAARASLGGFENGDLMLSQLAADEGQPDALNAIGTYVRALDAGAVARPGRVDGLGAGGYTVQALLVGGDQGGADLVPADGDVLSGAFTNVGLFHVPVGVTVFVDPGVALSVEADEILIEGVIDATGAGEAGGVTPPEPSSPGEPGAGLGGGEGGGFGNCVHGGGGGGGGYGGDGGDSSSLFGNNPPPAIGGSAYGDANPPGIEMGSGGGSAANYCNEVKGDAGGAGGGAVTLDADLITVLGQVLANGEEGVSDGPGSSGGGGSGGGILLDGCLTLTEGALRATGGDGGDAELGVGFGMAGGGGGGGRIKLAGTKAADGLLFTNVTGGAAGTTDALILANSVEATAGADGSFVDETEELEGPCGPPPPPPPPAQCLCDLAMDPSIDPMVARQMEILCRQINTQLALADQVPPAQAAYIRAAVRRTLDLWIQTVIPLFTMQGRIPAPVSVEIIDCLTAIRDAIP